MAEQRIKAVEWKTPGEVLGGEATAFTPWLAENLELLEAALGVEGLELRGTEHDIAGKRLDIIAAAGIETDDGETVGVAIENQYGRTEHGHLGQLITYVAGVSTTFDRVLGVWLVDEVHDAHEAAVELLNRETSERLGFVLARPRFVLLGDGSYGVDFDVVVRPNEFIKAEQRRAKVGNLDRAAFLTELAGQVEAPLRALGYTRVTLTHHGYSIDIPRGSSMWRIHVRANDPHDGFRAMVYVNGKSTTAENEALLARLLEHKEQILERVTYESVVDWSAHTTSKATKAAIARCRWPGFGYESDLADASDRLIQFAEGVAAAADAAGI